MQRQPNLAHVVLALGGPSCFAGHLDGRQQQGDQDSNTRGGATLRRLPNLKRQAQ
jgi:hypothetical protein